VLMMHLVAADRVKARPLAIIQAVTQSESAIVKCGSNGQEKAPKSRGLDG